MQIRQRRWNFEICVNVRCDYLITFIGRMWSSSPKKWSAAVEVYVRHAMPQKLFFIVTSVIKIVISHSHCYLAHWQLHLGHGRGGQCSPRYTYNWCVLSVTCVVGHLNFYGTCCVMCNLTNVAASITINYSQRSFIPIDPTSANLGTNYLHSRGNDPIRPI